MIKISLCLSALLFLAFSTNAQCRLAGGALQKPLRVRLMTEDGTPTSVESAFLNALRSIPDVTVRSGNGVDADVIVHVVGLDTKMADGTSIGAIFFFEVFRHWFCGQPSLQLQENFYAAGGIASVPPADIDTFVKDGVAHINVKAFEKLRQERDASPQK